MTTSVSRGTNPFLNRRPANRESTLSRLEGQIRDLEQRVDEAIEEYKHLPQPQPPAKPEQVMVWGVPFSRLTLTDTLRHVTGLIQSRTGGYFITANLNYNMLTAHHPQLHSVNEKAAFIVCDGMPMVWWSRRFERPLPERVAGSELIYALTKWAAHQGHRVFFLGGAPGVAGKAAEKLKQRYPHLQVAGVECPPFRPLTDQEETELVERIRDSRPDIVYIALGQPKGEIWMARNYHRLGTPVCVQIGASFDFVAGGVARAPRWVQKTGMEWLFRLAQEPRRLIRRYWNNGLFLIREVIHELISGRPKPAS